MCKVIIDSPYKIESRKLFPLMLEHDSVIGKASYDSDSNTFTIEPFESVKHLVNELLDNGYQFSTGGSFDNRNLFVLNELSIVQYPRFKSEVIR